MKRPSYVSRRGLVGYEESIGETLAKVKFGEPREATADDLRLQSLRQRRAVAAPRHLAIRTLHTGEFYRQLSSRV